jgi:hypothetical protein
MAPVEYYSNIAAKKRGFFAYIVCIRVCTCMLAHTIVNSIDEQLFLLPFHDNAYGNAIPYTDSRTEKVKFFCVLKRLSDNRTAFLFDGSLMQ